MQRCSRCVGHELYERYHDEERGVPVYDDIILFEFLMLEGAQAGLSWITILKRRNGYREAFANCDIHQIAQFDEDMIQQLLLNTQIIRHPGKIRSVVNNASIFLTIQKEFGSFSEYIWSWTEGAIIKNAWTTFNQVPTTTPLSERISKDLKKRGMSFVGPTSIYAYLQAVGVVNDHVVDCWRYDLV